MLRPMIILVQLAAVFLRWCELSVSIGEVSSGREPFSAATAGSLHGTWDEAPANGPADCACLAIAMVRLARRCGGGAPRDDDPLAPHGLEALLADKVAGWPTIDSTRDSGAHSSDGQRQSLVG